jgi:shikimate dehydrogenase
MTEMYGLIGRKLGHSFSKGYFTEKFHASDLDAMYENFELAEVEAFPALRAAHPQLRGCNVTIPYKEAILPYLDGLSPLARAVGAVNCIAFRDGLAIGHNTDVIGFRDSLAEVYAGAPGGMAMILGTGGAAKAVDHALAHYFEFEEILLVSRQVGGPASMTYSELANRGWGDCRLVVNTTPLGMFPDLTSCPEIDLTMLPATALVYDLIYNPEETTLLAKARALGLSTQNGLDMLMRQAEASWEIWNV